MYYSQVLLWLTNKIFKLYKTDKQNKYFIIKIRLKQENTSIGLSVKIECVMFNLT